MGTQNERWRKENHDEKQDAVTKTLRRVVARASVASHVGITFLESVR